MVIEWQNEAEAIIKYCATLFMHRFLTRLVQYCFHSRLIVCVCVCLSGWMDGWMCVAISF